MIWLHIFRITNHETSVSENTFDMCVPKNNKVHFWKKKHWYCEIFKNLNRQLQSMYGIYFMLLAIFRLAYHFLQNHCSWHKKNIINKYKVAKGPRRLKTKQKWRAKEAKSKSISGDLRTILLAQCIITMKPLSFLIIKPMGLLKVDLLTSWYYIVNQKIIEKS